MTRLGNEICSGAIMFASILRTALLWLGQGGVDQADADVDYIWFFLGTASLIFGALWLLVRIFPSDTKAPQSSRSSRAPATPNPRCARRLRVLGQTATRSSRPLPRRVISLHAVTPGQSQHEYNVGDRFGTRGSALSRVA